MMMMIPMILVVARSTDFTCSKHWGFLFLTPGVTAQWYSPCLGPWDLKKRFWVQTHCCAGENPACPLPLSLTWGCQLLVRSGRCCDSKKKTKKLKTCLFLCFAFFFHVLGVCEKEAALVRLSFKISCTL
jgi:hypothetical protein